MLVRLGFLALVALVVAGFLIARSGDTRASFAAGQSAFESGEYDAAMDTWRQAAEDGSANAQYGMGYLYQKGLGLKQPRPDLALKWYEKAARQSHTDAMVALARLYQNAPPGVPKNLPAAREWYRQAAQIADNREAEYALGMMHFRGEGTPLDYGRAVGWFRRAAERGHPGAQYIMGAIHETGWGVEKSRARAWAWYRMVEEQPPGAAQAYNEDFDPAAALEDLEPRMNIFDKRRGKEYLARLRGDGAS